MYGSSGLKPQDILVLLKLLLWEDRRPWSFAKLAKELGMSPSEVHAAIKRAQKSDLYDPLTRRPKREGLKEFLLFGLRYAFPGELDREKQSKGIPTGHSAPPLCNEVVSSPQDQIVWASRGGKMTGIALVPLYRSVPRAVSKDPHLHELLALIDAIRVGRARERELAKAHIEKRLGSL